MIKQYLITTLLVSILLLSCSKQATTPPNAAQLNDLFQMVIDFEPLQEYYHTEVPGRDTLCLVLATDTLDLDLIKFDNPVVIVHGIDDCYNAIIVRTFQYSVDGRSSKDSLGTATFLLDYGPANVLCKQVYQWTGEGWQLSDSHMIER